MYSIEVFLLDQKKLDDQPSGLIVVWAVNAVGDRSLTYMCPQCGHLYPPGYTQLIHAETKEEFVKCPDCGALMPDMLLQSSYGFKAELSQVATQMAEIYEKAQRNASVRLRRFKSNKTYHDTISAVKTTQYEDMLHKSRSDSAQEWIDYPAERVQQDVGLGAEAVKVFHNFLKV
jgi:predicted RNA-binding Zn-ribbon protein involved in translation (DUF1610 family)